MMRTQFGTRVGFAVFFSALMLFGSVDADDRSVEQAGYNDDEVNEHHDAKTKFLFHKDRWQSKKDAQGFSYSFIPHYARPMAYHYRPDYHFSSNYGLRAYGWYQGRGGFNYGLPYGYSPAHDRLDYQSYLMNQKNKTEASLQPPPQGYPYAATYYRRHENGCGVGCCCGGGIPMAGYPCHKYYSYSQFAGGNCPPGFAGSW